MCAAKELQILGVRLWPEYLDALRRTMAGRRTRRAVPKSAETIDEAQIWGLTYIAGYTEGGAPFGLTQEEIADPDGSSVPGAEDDDAEPW